LEKFEFTKVVVGGHTSKHRQTITLSKEEGQLSIKHYATRIPLKPAVNSGAPEGKEFYAIFYMIIEKILILSHAMFMERIVRG
jgi:hypothetical protein